MADANNKDAAKPARRRVYGKSPALRAAEEGRADAESKLSALRKKTRETAKVVGNGALSFGAGAIVSASGGMLADWLRPKLPPQWQPQASAMGAFVATLIGSKLVKKRELKAALQAAGFGAAGALVDMDALMKAAKGAVSGGGGTLPTPPANTPAARFPVYTPPRPPMLPMPGAARPAPAFPAPATPAVPTVTAPGAVPAWVQDV